MSLGLLLIFFIFGVCCLADGRRGLAYSNATLAAYFRAYSSVSWGYNWGYPANGLDKKWDYSPMLWGNPSNNPSYISSWQANVESAAKNGSTHLLAFNEPDINNLSPSDAAAAYKSYMQPYAGRMSLGAPAVTNGGPPTGLTWLEQFIGNCSGCTIDFGETNTPAYAVQVLTNQVPIHWYANWDQPDYFAAYIQQAYAAGGHRPLWITEFQGEGTNSQQISFLNKVLPWLDSLAYVPRYAYFGVFKNLLINADETGLSDIGKAFATITGVNSTVPTASGSRN